MTTYFEKHPSIIGNGGHARVVYSELGPCTVVAIGSPVARKREAEAHPDWKWTRFKALCGNEYIELDEGTQVLRGAVLGVGCKIGKHVIINHNAVVDHDCVVGDYAHIAPCASLSGGTKVGEGAWIGTGARVVSGEVPPWMLVRANSVYPNDYNKGIHKLKAVK